MTTFIDGPAAGQSMMLKRRVTLLRVTRKRFALSADPDHQKAPVIDALDQLEDTPNPDEEIFVYINTGRKQGAMFVDYGGNKKHLSGGYVMAEYSLYCVQPADEILRDNVKWRAWCETQRERLGL